MGVLPTSSILTPSNQVSNTLLQRNILETLPDCLVEIVADLHFDPYFGDDETESLYFSQAKRGTTAFHAYATLHAHVRNKHWVATRN